MEMVAVYELFPEFISVVPSVLAACEAVPVALLLAVFVPAALYEDVGVQVYVTLFVMVFEFLVVPVVVPLVSALTVPASASVRLKPLPVVIEYDFDTLYVP